MRKLALPVVLLLAALVALSHAFPQQEHNTQIGKTFNQDALKEEDRGLKRSKQSKKESVCGEDEYLHGEHCCKMCPAGTSVKEGCVTPHKDSICKSCIQGQDYTTGPNGLPNCVSCQKCKAAAGKRMVSECTITKDTVCKCQAEKFCPRNHPCEVCKWCKKCPEGQEVKRPCTATTDTGCGSIPAIDHVVPLTNSTSEPASEEIRKKLHLVRRMSIDSKKQSTFFFSDKEIAENSINSQIVQSTGNPTEEEMVSPLLRDSGRSTPSLHTKAAGEDSSTADQFDPTSHLSVSQNENGHLILPLGPDSECLPVANPSLMGSSKFNGEIEMVAESGATLDRQDKIGLQNVQLGNTLHLGREQLLKNEDLHPKDLRDTFYIFVSEVPVNSFKEFMRRLKLTENDIEVAVVENPQNIKNQYYKMLYTWLLLRGKEASIQNLLDVLYEMNLKATAEKISEQLVKNE
ncbi:uncharacterized protein LOC102366259 isoform X2 [Latimeria chalumnae]|uniref:uncharacterized protein LOC102366259 isoform X2 n=1 Tax=Latimeria chalumnae TaxID=7897 RepID=UPI0003C17865|nr:PREDICTED: uncharacterized protein LOC102366259 isoform X2 [Latimeria chalumnae]|eukprot:XP_005992658.1 PREDICTED: uncharacterized protein LOC102366259 isoform X2 [Latimeria chalumnae]